MKKTLIIVASGVALLTGCATGEEYRQYTEAQKAIVNAKAMAEAARYQALTEIAKSGDASVKAAAIVGLS